MLLSLAAVDLAVDKIVGSAYFRDSKRLSQFTRYFDYGRSIEGKVLSMSGIDGSKPHPLALTGWIGPAVGQPERRTKQQDLLVAGYGMSFAANILREMRNADGRVGVRFAGGPGATLSHSYAMYTADRFHHEADVVVLGILASSLPGLMTVSHMTWNFEAPAPHFYPRFRASDGKLVQDAPLVTSLVHLQEMLQDPSSWRELQAKVAASDAFYDGLVFRAWSLDESVLARLARRGWGQASKRRTIARFYDHRGFKNEMHLLDVTRMLVSKFVAQVRDDGKLPVILAINDRGYADHLHQVLAQIVDPEAAVYFSTHVLADASDHSNFLKDGHFVPAQDAMFGRRLGELIRTRLERH